MVGSKYFELTFPVIIMRMGGLDGVALQKREYRELLNTLDINVHAIAGVSEKQFSTTLPIGHQESIIEELSFDNKISKLIFANQFKLGFEKEGVPEISISEWKKLFDSHKQKIKNKVGKVIESIPNNTPVIVYNLLALRHSQPAAAVALKEIIQENPNRGFLSHAADPDAERPKKIARIKNEALKKISADSPDKPYSGGPYYFDNLYHIVLNPTQKKNFAEKYGIPEKHIFEIPDFLDFQTEELKLKKKPDRIFIDYLASSYVVSDGDSCRYEKRKVNPDGVFFLTPVRPVERKKIRELMLLARLYEITKEKDLYFIVTHPNIDDPPYFQQTVEFAEKIGLNYLHLGKSFTLETLEFVYDNLSPVNCVGAVASSAGGWENALNEMANSGIPFFMSTKLNSYFPLTQQIKIKTLGVDFEPLYKLCDDILSDKKTFEEIRPILAQFCENTGLFLWISNIFDRTERKKLIEHNYRQALKFLSHEASAPKLLEAILYIYARHGLPGRPGEKCIP